MLTVDLVLHDRLQAEDYIHRYWTPMQWDIFRKEQQLQPYFDIPEQVYQANRERLGLAAPSYTAYKTQADEEARGNAATHGLGPEMVSDRDYPIEYRKLRTMIEQERERYRRKNPDKTKLLIELGYKTASKADIARAGGGGGGLPGLEPIPLPSGGAGLGGLEPLPLPTFGR
jgi:hypothetical protein